jgi:hypothetical protein
MDGQDLIDVLRSDHDRALDRLGSSKSLYASTDGATTVDRVHGVAVAELAAARTTFESWAEEESDGTAASLFEATGAAAATHHDAIGPSPHEPGDPSRKYGTLHSFDGTPARLGGVLGWSLVTIATIDQMVDFFAGHADSETADAYRAVRKDLAHFRDRSATTIGMYCETDREWAIAEDAAGDVIEETYAEYVESLESLDVDPEGTQDPDGRTQRD